MCKKNNLNNNPPLADMYLPREMAPREKPHNTIESTFPTAWVCSIQCKRSSKSCREYGEKACFNVETVGDVFNPRGLMVQVVHPATNKE